MMTGHILITKAWYQSKTVWVQILTLAVAVITDVSGTELIQAYPQLASAFVGLLAVLNAVLRWLTDEPITSIVPGLDSFRRGRVFVNRTRSQKRFESQGGSVRANNKLT